MPKNVFTTLHPKLAKLVRQRFDKPTPIQQAVIPKILSGSNVLSLSETGSGKTESALLPIFSKWLETSPKPISILYITPLRSLNRDLLNRIMWWSQNLDLDASVRHGDTTQYERKHQAENPPDMLISTPETLQAMLTGKLMRNHLRNIRYVVLDEVHELVSNKRGLQLSVGLERLKELISSSSEPDNPAGTPSSPSGHNGPAGNPSPSGHNGPAGNPSQSGSKSPAKNPAESRPAPQIIALSATVGTPDKVAEFFNLNNCHPTRPEPDNPAGNPSQSGHNGPAGNPSPSGHNGPAGNPSPSGHNGPAKNPALKSPNPSGKSCRIVNTVKTKKTSIRVESPRPSKKDQGLTHRMKVSTDVVSRLHFIREMINSRESVLIFTNTREFAEILSSRLKALDKGLSLETHHSSLSKDIRIAAEKGFKDQSIKSLVSTSSLELGIDIGSIDLVLQYQSPRQVGKFMQRVGRSGHRLTKVSDGIIISGDPEDSFESTVIANLALKHWVEPTMTYGKSWDVLGLQILGLAMDEYKIPAKRAFDIIRRAAPFRLLTYDEFMETALLLQKLRLIWVDTKFSENGEPLLKRRSKAFQHYYFNLSTIPDVRNYRIVDGLSNKTVGTLDAEFIAMHGSPGTSFIVKGQAWRIIDIGKTRVLVEPTPGIEAAIPAWEGELIPVPYEVAQGVASLKEEILDLSRTHKKPEVIKSLAKKYPISRDVALKLYDHVRVQEKYGFVPTRKRLVIEHASDEDGWWLIFHTHWGSTINETVGRTLSHIITPRMGSVGLQTDPYRIMLRLQKLSDWNDAVRAFRSLRPRDVSRVMTESLPGSEMFNWRFIHVCKRFGIIRRDADFGKGYIKKIAEVYANTPPFREAINEVLQEKLDVPGSERILGQLSRGEMRLDIRQGLSPWGTAGVARKYEIMAPARPEKEIFSVFKNRILDTRLGLICTNCGDWATIDAVRDVPERPHCPLCGSIMIAAVPDRYLIDAQELIRKRKAGKPLNKEESGHMNHITRTAAMVSSSGRNAVIALSGRGVGPATAGRILSKMVDGDEFYKEILRAERNYAKTKRFWK